MTCTPAQTVYDTHLNCLPFTGLDILPIILVGILLLLLGLMTKIWLSHQGGSKTVL